MNLEVGSTIGDYQVIAILGAGGMGKVYKVRNTISDRVEAMKVLLPDLAHDPDLADRFQREIRVHASLEHPHIAGLHTALKVDNQLLMLMEFVEGVTLEEKLKSGPLPVAEAAEYIRQVLDALEYAHAHGVIHRDIKPANMMLTRGGVIKLMDFGIARASADRRLTMTGTTVGSLYYMSPEQIQGVAAPDPRADLYSVGVSLYEMVTGKRPFDGDSQYAIMAAHLEKTPVPPIELDPRLPAPLNEVILMAVAKDPDKRFQTAAAFRNALGSSVGAAEPEPVRIQPTMPIAAAVLPAVPVAVARPRSRRWLWMGLGGAAAALAIVAAIEMGPRKDAKAAPQTTSAPAQAAKSEPAAAAPPVTEPQPTAPANAASGPPPAAAPVQTHDQATPAGKVSSNRPAAGTPPQQPMRAAQQPPAAPPVQPTGAPAAAQTASPPPAVAAPAPAAASKSDPSAAAMHAQLQETREEYVLLNSRATGIRASLQSLRQAQAAQGLNLNSRLQGPADLMDQYLEGASAAIQAGDPGAAKGFLEKAERQAEILEKLLNR